MKLYAWPRIVALFDFRITFLNGQHSAQITEKREISRVILKASAQSLFSVFHVP